MKTQNQPIPNILNGQECFWPLWKANLENGQDLILQIPGQQHTVQNWLTTFGTTRVGFWPEDLGVWPQCRRTVAGFDVID